MVTDPDTIHTRRWIAAVIGRDLVHSTQYRGWPPAFESNNKVLGVEKGRIEGERGIYFVLSEEINTSEKVN